MQNDCTYLKLHIKPEAFFSFLIPSSILSCSSPRCGVRDLPLVVEPFTVEGDVGDPVSLFEAILINESPNCLSLLKGCRQIIWMRSHCCSRAFFEKDAAKQESISKSYKGKRKGC